MCYSCRKAQKLPQSPVWRLGPGFHSRYGLDWKVRRWNPGGDESLRDVQTGPGSTQHPAQWARDLFPGGKEAGAWL